MFSKKFLRNLTVRDLRTVDFEDLAVVVALVLPRRLALRVRSLIAIFAA
jgi:hypothetical protein